MKNKTQKMEIQCRGEVEDQMLKCAIEAEWCACLAVASQAITREIKSRIQSLPET